MRAPYDKPKKSSRKSVCILPGALYCLVARLIATTYNYDNSSFPVYN